MRLDSVSSALLESDQSPTLLQPVDNDPRPCVPRQLITEIWSSDAVEDAGVSNDEDPYPASTSTSTSAASARVSADGAIAGGSGANSQVDDVAGDISGLEALQTTFDALLAVPMPPESVYAPVGGAPYTTNPVDQREAQLCSDAAADAMLHLADSISQMGFTDLDFGPSPFTGHGQGSSVINGTGTEEKRTGLRPGVLIEEILESDAQPPEPERVSVAAIVLLCALYGADSRLEGSWVSQATADAALAVLAALTAKLKLALPGVWTDFRKRSPHLPEPILEDDKREVLSDMQCLISVILPAAIQQIKPAMADVKPRRKTGSITEPINFKPEGPSTYIRSLAARQLSWLVRQMERSTLITALPRILPAVLAVLDDPSPFVECQGLWALHHVAVTLNTEDLQWQRALLLETAKHAVGGCDERVWSAAATTAVALVLTLEGGNPWASGYDDLVKEMLGEAELHMQQPKRSAPWLIAMYPLYPALGLAMVRYYSRLMPLLLDWLHSPHQATQLESLRAMQSIICNTWPRIPPHASLIRQHLQVLRNSWASSPAAGEIFSEQSNLDSSVGCNGAFLASRLQIVGAIEDLLSWCSPAGLVSEIEA